MKATKTMTTIRNIQKLNVLCSVVSSCYCFLHFSRAILAVKDHMVGKTGGWSLPIGITLRRVWMGRGTESTPTGVSATNQM
jgi:hypothetical protein